jgi:hypothetical protein
MTVRLNNGVKQELTKQLFRAFEDFTATAQLGRVMSEELVARLIARQA